ncbi:LCP family protein [Nonomuraea soli]|uniref:LCP family protein required for cell wall assembly n=1 Tax=Nonomuraea soli TaxID=1032476 RepID=A0A7W0HTB2_9ACTN|nr:LCP family protein [Nonomuraea soli]MBA2894757.1 LCP family protein required for cell wall assembly [Nonomuraea soli]
MTSGAVLGWTLLSIVAPGAAHLRAGWRKTGLTLLSIYFAGILALLALALFQGVDLAGSIAASSSLLITVTVGAAVLGLAWFALVVHSFIVLKPSKLPQNGQILVGTVAGLMAVLVIAPFGLTAQSLWVGNDTLNDIFTGPASSSGREAAPVKREDPWAGRTRVNILVLGGDADDHRSGVRTDSMHLASIDVKTGNTVLFSLPRNLEFVPFKPGTPMAERFPQGFQLPGASRATDDLLNSVWEYSDAHPEIFGGRKNMGPQVLKETIGHILGVDIDWYVLANMWGFARLIDAIGGVTLTVETDVVFGRYNEGLVKAGTRRLKGADAMWYARSRTNSDDYTRMRRQRCVIGALLGQADPATVLSRFTAVAKATKQLIRTDIPRAWLEHLVPLALKVKGAKVRSVQFVPPLIKTYSADWEKIRTIAAKALKESATPRPVAAMGSPSPSPSPSASMSSSRTATPSPTPSRTNPATDLTEGCGGI